MTEEQFDYFVTRTRARCRKITQGETSAARGLVLLTAAVAFYQDPQAFLEDVRQVIAKGKWESAPGQESAP